jgi:hypothetical protein
MIMLHMGLLVVAGMSPPGLATVRAMPWQVTSAVSTVEALEATGRSSSRPHNLLDVMCDKESGLCSEGVWHNAWLGVSHILIGRQLRALGDTGAAESLSSAKTIGDSLFALSFDGTGFRRRSASGMWEAPSASELEATGEDPAFYEPSDAHRCASSGAVAIFYSLLAEEEEAGTPEAEAAEERSLQVFDAFTSSFFDTSTCRFRREDAGTSETASEDASGDAPPAYWRAVDQAMGCLACLRMAKVGHKTASSRAMASCAADSLLREFGYSLYATEGQPPGTYLGRAPQPPRNSWHDGLASLALLSSGVLGVGGETPAGLVRSMTDSYRDSETGAIFHLPREARTAASQAEAEVAFSSTQALWSAIVRASDLENERAAAVGGADVPALRTWCETQRRRDSSLLPVANVYPTPRLWANTEWAAFVLLDKKIFGES